MAKYLGRISHAEDIANKQYVDDQVQIALSSSLTVDEGVKSHIANKDNPHSVTKSQVGLSLVDNVRQASKSEFLDHDGNTTRHTTAIEKNRWNSKQDALEAGNNISIDGNTISAIDTIYTHPSSHPASMITESSTKRFVTDTEKSNWNNKTDNTAVNAHIVKKDNPHSVTKAQVGLANVDNVKQATKTEFDTHNADTTKHITKAERDAWNAKQGNLTAGANISISGGVISAVDTIYDDTTVQSHMSNRNNPHGVTKSQVGLGNVSNVAQASKTEFDSHNSDTTKHITASERTAWNNKQNALGFTPERASNKGKAGGYASLDSGGKVPASELPSYVDDVVEGTSLSNLPKTGETGKIYVTTNDNKTYRWSGTGYTEISASLALGTTSSTAYRGDRGNIAYNHSQATGNPHGTTKAQVGLGNVDNTSDANKPVSTAMQNALNNKADKSQVLTNVPANAKFTDTVYTHPSKHPASIITETSTKRFVTDAEKNNWNSKTNDATVNAHIAKRDNPHNVTKAQVGLGNVNNTSDANKPVSNATKAALDKKADKSYVDKELASVKHGKYAWVYNEDHDSLDLVVT